jgi:hypothetical protein
MWVYKVFAFICCLSLQQLEFAMSKQSKWLLDMLAAGVITTSKCEPLSYFISALAGGQFDT